MEKLIEDKDEAKAFVCLMPGKIKQRLIMVQEATYVQRRVPLLTKVVISQRTIDTKTDVCTSGKVNVKPDEQAVKHSYLPPLPL